MVQLPWAFMRSKRLSLGMTQSEFAAGIVSQSSLSLIEKGKMIPSTRQLIKFANKLHMPEEELLPLWETHRVRPQLKSQLFNAGQNGDVSDIERMLNQARPFLSTFETCIYLSLLEAMRGNHLHSENLLTMAWAQGANDNVCSSEVRLEHLPTLERRRALVMEALVRALNYQAVGRCMAAEVWAEKRNERRRGRPWVTRAAER